MALLSNKYEICWKPSQDIFGCLYICLTTLKECENEAEKPVY